ncbi:MAG: HAD-IA family hydrolase, partial [Acetobacteraceae bacterium]|nr:HAD-IA family hydrolase [Acetobacteraceae bacterium]
PEAPETLRNLANAGVKLGVVTNCSETLGQIAALRTGAAFDVIVTAEHAGWYKPDPRAYQAALDQLHLPPQRCLFVAGSAYDLPGAAAAGLQTYWHNRTGMAALAGVPEPLAQHRSLNPLPGIVLADRHLTSTHTVNPTQASR